MAQAVQVATPNFNVGTGSYINSVFVTIQTNTPSARICYSIDGSTPTATVAGTCDAGFYSSTGAFVGITTTGTVLKAIGTLVGDTNSTVASATYTITSLPATNPVGNTTPVKITSAGANIVDELPFLMKAANGDLFLFYGESTGGLSVDSGANSRIMFKKSTNSGASWTVPANFSCPVGDPATGCFYDNASANTQNLALGGGTTSTNTMIMLASQWTSGGAAVNGILEFRSTDNGATWTNLGLITTPSNTANKMINPTSNLISIPSGSAGVTGSCATGCIFTPVLGQAGGITGLIFSFDDGFTWGDPIGMPAAGRNTWPYSAEENAVIWLGGMNLLVFSRPSADNAITDGWPTAIGVLYSSNLGASWNSYTLVSGGSSTQYGALSNLPVSTCSIAPNTNWADTFTRPSVVTDPANASLSTILYGERLICNGVNKYRWQIVTFNSSSAFANSGQNLPLPQILDLDPVTTAQPHTTYSHMVPLGANTLLMTYEQGNTTTTEDIYTTVLTYRAPGLSISGGMKLSGGPTIK